MKSIIIQFLDMLRQHNAVFLGDEGLREAYNEFLRRHKVPREVPTPGQLDYQEKLVTLFPVVKKVD